MDLEKYNQVNAILFHIPIVIIAHNHPTNDPTPSTADITATKSLEKACRAVDLMLLDHLIIADSSYYSFTEDRESEYNETILKTLAAA